MFPENLLESNILVFSVESVFETLDSLKTELIYGNGTIPVFFGTPEDISSPYQSTRYRSKDFNPEKFLHKKSSKTQTKLCVCF